MRNKYLKKRMPEIEDSCARCDATVAELLNSIIKEYLYHNIMHETQSLKSFISDIEKRVIEYSLFLTQGNQKGAANLIGMNPTTFFEKMKKYSIVYTAAEKPRDYTKTYREMILLSFENQHHLKQGTPM